MVQQQCALFRRSEIANAIIAAGISVNKNDELALPESMLKERSRLII
ncbi:hypothetical protein OH492_04245 [Vibrio chagasii]|nr:hypothetical protein [Vibrio chagasii]